MTIPILLAIIAASSAAALLGIWRLADSLMFLVIIPAVIAAVGVITLAILAVMLAMGVA